MAAVGIMPREVRLVVLSLGLVLTGVFGGVYIAPGSSIAGDSLFDLGRGALTLALAIIAVGATITVIQRVLHVRSQAKSAVTPVSPTTNETRSTT
jgi:TRAP-type C4-dicarboxylate transport system permease small subunit